MALINCPECGKEISEQVEACPRCGYPIQRSWQNSKPESGKTKVLWRLANKKLMIAFSMILAIAAIVLSLFFVGRFIQLKKYADGLSQISETMLYGVQKSQELCELTAQVWTDAIHKDFDNETIRYTIKPMYYKPGSSFYDDYEYVDDFNDALQALYSDKDTLKKIETITNNQTTAESLMKELANPPKRYVSSFEALEGLYGSYRELTNLAISPKGSLTTFNQSRNEKEERFDSTFEMFKIKIPFNLEK